MQLNTHTLLRWLMAVLGSSILTYILLDFLMPPTLEGTLIGDILWLLLFVVFYIVIEYLLHRGTGDSSEE
jgi:hypothetical protein